MRSEARRLIGENVVAAVIDANRAHSQGAVQRAGQVAGVVVARATVARPALQRAVAHANSCEAVAAVENRLDLKAVASARNGVETLNRLALNRRGN